MKLKIWLQIAVLFMLTVSAAYAATVVNDVSRNPFYTPPLSSEGDLRQMMDVRRDEIREALNQAGYPDLYQPLMEQFPHVQVTAVEYHPGQTFLWMLSRQGGNGPVYVVMDIVLGGAASVPAYEFCIYKDGNRYIFAVPFACGNLALKEIIPEHGQAWGVPLHFVADAGYLYQSDPANYLLLRVGLEHAITPRLSLLAMIGGAPQVSGDDGAGAFLIDFLLQYDWFQLAVADGWSPVFVGAGLGGWITSGDEDEKKFPDSADTDLDLIFNIGTRIYGHPDGFNTSLFFEARSAVDELDNIPEYGRFGGGLRFRF